MFKGSLMKIATEEKDQLRYFADIVSGMCLYGGVTNACRRTTLFLMKVGRFAWLEDTKH